MEYLFESFFASLGVMPLIELDFKRSPFAVASQYFGMLMVDNIVALGIHEEYLGAYVFDVVFGFDGERVERVVFTDVLFQRLNQHFYHQVGKDRLAVGQLNGYLFERAEGTVKNQALDFGVEMLALAHDHGDCSHGPSPENVVLVLF